MKSTLKKTAQTVLLIMMAAGAAAAGDALEFKPLPYAFDALEPHIDARTMEIHYSRHHKAYFNNLLKAVEGTELAGRPLEDILASVDALPASVRNNGGGHWNHTMFWQVMSPDGGGVPGGALAEQIEKDFGSFDEFQKKFNEAAATRFGSGWAWLCVAEDGSLFVTSTPNQDNPLMKDADLQGTPILSLDVWEHAYYLKYQNLRGSYIEAFWNVVNWPEVAKRYAAAGMKSGPPAPE